MTRLRLVAFVVLLSALPAPACGGVSALVSLSGGSTEIGRSVLLHGHTHVGTLRGDVFLWKPSSPLYYALGFAHSREAEGEHDYYAGDVRYYARADYWDAATGSRIALSSHLAFYLGFGVTWLSSGYVRAEDKYGEIVRDDISRFGYLIHLGAVATDTHGLSLNLAARLRGLHEDITRGDVIHSTQHGGLELTAGVGWEFGRAR